MGDTDRFDQDVRFQIYDFIVEHGRPPVAAEIAPQLDTTPFNVEVALRRLHDAHILVLAPGTPYVWMANPFSAVPTPYQAHVGERIFFGNCIWDSLGIIAMLGDTGRVGAKCPDCAEDLSVDVRDGEVRTTDYVVHYLVPAAHWWDDIGFN